MGIRGQGRVREAGAARGRRKGVSALPAWLPAIAAELRPGGRQEVRRDPEAVAALARLMRVAAAYFAAEVRGWENLPRRGPFLIVGNHSGGIQTMDVVPLMARWVEERGPHGAPFILAHDVVFRFPFLGSWFRRIGMVEADLRKAEALLRRGYPLVVFPGGDHEVFRPWNERNRIDFAGRTGFVALSLRARVPVVPMTIHGAHEAVIILARGERLARLTGLDKRRIKVFPLAWNIPFGPAPASLPSIPLPTKFTVEIGKPLRWYRRYGPERARDLEVLRRCYDEITGIMQETMDRLAQERPSPIAARLGELRRDLGRVLSPRATSARSEKDPAST